MTTSSLPGASPTAPPGRPIRPQPGPAKAAPATGTRAAAPATLNRRLPAATRTPPPRPNRPRTAAPALPPPTRIGRSILVPALVGFLLIATFLGGFAAWAMLVPVASGAIAMGTISPDGNRRTIQHFEGGIIAEILVRDGDKVAQGQPVIVLENTRAKATHDALAEQYHAAQANRARLYAEVMRADRIDFPADLDARDPQMQAIMRDQQAMFDRRRANMQAQRAILGARDLQMGKQVDALRAQAASVAGQIALIDEDLTAKQGLKKKGLAILPQMLALERQAVQLQGDAGRFDAAIAEIADKRAEIASQLLSLDADQAERVAGEYDLARADLAAAQQQLDVSADVLNRTVILSPVAGSIVNSRFMSPGGVVQAAQPIMDVVPANERLLIDARVSVMDIDVVHPGMDAVVRLTALASFRLPRIEGRVVSVSGDRLTDPATGQSYYLARVEVTPQSLAKIGDAELMPGMPAEVLLTTSERTMAGYLLEPILATFRRGFHED